MSLTAEYAKRTRELARAAVAAVDWLDEHGWLADEHPPAVELRRAAGRPDPMRGQGSHSASRG